MRAKYIPARWRECRSRTHPSPPRCGAWQRPAGSRRRGISSSGASTNTWHQDTPAQLLAGKVLWPAQNHETPSVKTCLSSVNYNTHNILSYEGNAECHIKFPRTVDHQVAGSSRCYLVARRPVFPLHRRHHHRRGQVLGLALAADKNLTLDTGSHSRRHVRNV